MQEGPVDADAGDASKVPDIEALMLNPLTFKTVMSMLEQKEQVRLVL